MYDHAMIHYHICDKMFLTRGYTTEKVAMLIQDFTKLGSESFNWWRHEEVNITIKLLKLFLFKPQMSVNYLTIKLIEFILFYFLFYFIMFLLCYSTSKSKDYFNFFFFF